MSDPSKLDEYCERIINEYKDFPPIDYQLGYPLNYKDQVKNAEVRYEISKYQPVIINIGRSLNIKQTDRVSSMPIERDLILKIMAPWGGNEGNTWAYITSGGTEGNIAAIQFGLRQLQKPILIFSTETHYSIQKAIAQKQSQFSFILQIPTLSNGEIDCKQISPSIHHVIGPSVSPKDIPPVLMVATLGSTNKGACDDVISILKSLYSIGVTRDKIFVHLDAAFDGGFWHLDEQNPNYQIGEEFNSIAISGNKWYGSDICGIFAMYLHESSTLHPEDNIEYLEVQDVGITTCRNGFNAISWMVRYVQFDWKQEYETCRKNLNILVRRFKFLGIETFVNPASLKVCTPILPQDIVTKYRIVCCNDVHFGNMCRIVVCPHVTEEIIDQFFGDLQVSGELETMKKRF